MAEYTWPVAEKRTLIGKRISRVDGPDKVSGRAKYTYDVNRPGLLHGKIVRSPHAHAKVVSVDTSAAEALPGVKAVQVVQGPGTEIFWWKDEVAAVAAVDEPTAEDAARAVKVQYETLPYLVDDYDLQGAGENAKPAGEQVQGEPDRAFSEADVVSEGEYGASVMTHCCLEAHGAVCEWDGDGKLLVHVSTQNVSGIAAQMAGPLGIPAGDIRVKQDHIGGGFGSKFGPDRWTIVAAQLSKKAGGQPVKIMLERDAEQSIAGSRPSCLREGQDRRPEGRNGHRLAVGQLGQRGCGRRRPSSHPVRARHSQPARPAHGDRDERRAAPGPGGRRTIPRPASSPWALSRTWPPSWVGIPSTSCSRTSP